MSRTLSIGDRVSYSSALCTIRFIGFVKNTGGEWLGVEWDDPKRGKHNGTRDGIEYFKCWSPSPTAGSFVRPTRKPDPERTFLEAVYHKYATEDISLPNLPDKEIVISGKVAEEIGFDKIREQQAQLHELKIVIVDGLQIKHAAKANENIRETCPSIVELDLSRNIFGSFQDVMAICENLPNLKKLRLNGNRFSELVDPVNWPSLNAYQPAFSKVTELEMDENLLDWQTLAVIKGYFPSLVTFGASSNGFRELRILDTSVSSIQKRFLLFSLTDSLKSVTMEYNEFRTLEDLVALTSLPVLESLRLKDNKISSIGTSDHCCLNPSIKFPPTLRYLDISYNLVDSWSFIDLLPKAVPGLTSLRFSHNPVYEEDFDVTNTARRNDVGFMLTVGHLKNLTTLNFSNITPQERTNAEIYYFSKITKEIEAVPEGDEGGVYSKHPRFDEFCNLYGAPVIRRKQPGEINPRFLEARLIKFHCYHLNSSFETKQTIEIPKSCDVYRAKSMIGKLFFIPPWKLRLIHETGDWDPVADYDDNKMDSENEEEMTKMIDTVQNSITEKGRWMKREVEIEDSTRQIGNLIDGLEAVLRIEQQS